VKLANRRLQPLGHVSGLEKVLEINTFSVNGRLRRERTEREQNGPDVPQKGEQVPQKVEHHVPGWFARPNDRDAAPRRAPARKCTVSGIAQLRPSCMHTTTERAIREATYYRNSPQLVSDGEAATSQRGRALRGEGWL
jgi:hypothetical protein